MNNMDIISSSSARGYLLVASLLAPYRKIFALSVTFRREEAQHRFITDFGGSSWLVEVFCDIVYSNNCLMRHEMKFINNYLQANSYYAINSLYGSFYTFLIQEIKPLLMYRNLIN